MHGIYELGISGYNARVERPRFEIETSTLKLAFVGVLALSAFQAMAQTLQPVSWKSVKVQDKFWKPRQDALFTHTLPEQFEQLVLNKYKQNFERAGRREKGGYVGYVFNDSDVYKVLEAASYALGIRRDVKVEQQLDEWIGLLEKAQESDGYLNCYFQLNEPDRKWTNLRDQHELYCAGHLFEAASAHYEATGKKSFLNVAIKLANHLVARFGEGKRMGYPGHPECELALMKLWRVTGDKNYYNLAKFFIDKRGSKFFATEHNTPLSQYEGVYWSDHKPIREMSSIEGHAVRAAYLFSGTADIAHETGDKQLISALDRVWKSTTERRMFITGGLGPSGSNEGFTVDYDLPTFSAYQESCASIANAFWNYRMNLLHTNAKYGDVMETAIYNGALAGINGDGDKYFYVNPLASNGNHHRVSWFGCACCPPNLSRMIGQIGGLAYATSADALYVNLFIGGEVRTQVGGKDATFKIETAYPYDGKVKFTYNGKGGNFGLKARKPSWCSVATVQGVVSSAQEESGNYLAIKREWKTGDSVTINFEMPVRRMLSNPNVKDTVGKYALMRGPLVYCLESIDNEFDFSTVGFPMTEKVSVVNSSTNFKGAPIIEGTAFSAPKTKWGTKLFSDAGDFTRVKFRALPYFLWDNRPKPKAANEMMVWLAPNPEPAPLQGVEVEATVGVSFKNYNSDPSGVNDGYVPANSNPNSPRQLHYWPHAGGQEWVTYTFKSDKKVGSSRVYWFDDTGRGGVRVPKSWKMQAKVGGIWTDVQLKESKYGIQLDQWVSIEFVPVVAREFRILMEQPQGFSSGLHEWQLFEEEN